MIIVAACLINVCSILLVARCLYVRWKAAMNEDFASGSATAQQQQQQDKQLSLMESQLQRSTPIVVLQPDRRVRPSLQQGCHCHAWHLAC